MGDPQNGWFIKVSARGPSSGAPDLTDASRGLFAMGGSKSLGFAMSLSFSAFSCLWLLRGPSVLLFIAWIGVRLVDT